MTEPEIQNQLRRNDAMIAELKAANLQLLSKLLEADRKKREAAEPALLLPRTQDVVLLLQPNLRERLFSELGSLRRTSHVPVLPVQTFVLSDSPNCLRGLTVRRFMVLGGDALLTRVEQDKLIVWQELAQLVADEIIVRVEGLVRRPRAEGDTIVKEAARALCS